MIEAVNHFEKKFVKKAHETHVPIILIQKFQ